MGEREEKEGVVWPCKCEMREAPLMIKARTVLKCARAVALGELQPLTLTRDYAAPLDEA